MLSKSIFIARGLSRLAAITVREDCGTELVRELSGRNAAVVLFVSEYLI